MGFNLYVPSIAARKSQFSCTLSEPQKRTANKLIISAPLSILGKWDGFDAVQTHIGDGVDHGKIMLVPSKLGEHKIARLMFAVNIRLQLQSDWVNAPFVGEICQHEWVNSPEPTSVILTLPKRLYEAPMVITYAPEKPADKVCRSGFSYFNGVLKYEGQALKFMGSEAVVMDALCKAYGAPVSSDIFPKSIDILGVVSAIRKRLNPLRLVIVIKDNSLVLSEA